MPISLHNSRKAHTISGSIGLPASIPPFEEADEAELVTTLLEELSGYYGLKLDAYPNMLRYGEASDDALGRSIPRRLAYKAHDCPSCV